MIQAEEFILAAKQQGFGFYTGVPCSYLKPFINYVIDSSDLRYVGAANEGDAIAIASGAELAGLRSVVMFQNSGLGNAVNPLTSLTHTFKVPMLLIVTLRGEPGGEPDEPQHELMGQITQSILELLQIPWEYFPTESEQLPLVLERAVQFMELHQRPYALVMRKNSVASYQLTSPVVQRPLPTLSTASFEAQVAQFTRHKVLAAIQAAAQPQDVIVATTGYCGRELYAIADQENHFYMIGSMGCASSFGLGIAIAQPQRRVIVIDGDGAALMRLSALSTIGYERPPNLVHILLDNQRHESTGGQATVSHSINFCEIAAACGYAAIATATTPSALQEQLAIPSARLTFLYVPMQPGIPEKLPRPKVTPPEVARRFRHFMQHEVSSSFPVLAVS